MPTTKLDVVECIKEIDDILREDITKDEWHEFISTDTAHLDATIAFYLDKYGYDKFLDKNSGLGPQINNIAEEALENIAKKGLIYYNQFRVATRLKDGKKYFKAEQAVNPESIVMYSQIKDTPKKVSYTLNSPEYQN